MKWVEVNIDDIHDNIVVVKNELDGKYYKLKMYSDMYNSEGISYLEDIEII